ncbi:MAG: uracil-DNA glycosylase family protein [Bacteroidales bacterium]
MKTFADKAIHFYKDLRINTSLPAGSEILNPYENPAVKDIVTSFFTRFYDDQQDRVILLGINPGRFGAGISGITFTDPIRLEEDCQIPNGFEKRAELSSRFIYDVISSYGGCQAFYQHFFLSAVSPLGFVRDGKNLNYYDDRELEAALGKFIESSLRDQIDLGIRKDKAICLGEGKNMKYLEKLNKKLDLFGEIISLPHPRWVMQYRFKRKEEFIEKYLEVLQSI